MGQYWITVNLDKREFINPHKVATGLKLWEQLANHPGTGAALIILTAAMPEVRGGGDFDLEKNWHGPEREFPEHNITPGPMPDDYSEIARRTIGRWAGDRIALIGDYAERSDLAPEHDADLVYDLCHGEEARQKTVAYMQQRAKEAGIEEYREKADRLASLPLYRDISDDVCTVIQHELNGKFVGEGWRDWQTV